MWTRLRKFQVQKNPAYKAFLVAVLVSLILPFIPVVRNLLMPFDFLNTHLHEAFHALAGGLTGGQVLGIKVFSNTEGVTTTAGGLAPAIFMAGYVGASLFGAWMIKVSNNAKNARLWVRILAIAILAANVLWVRGDAVGWPIGFMWSILLFWISAKLPDDQILFAAQFLGVQQCLNAFKSLRDLIFLSASGSGYNDAKGMEQITLVPAIVWALLWTGISTYGIVIAVLNFTKPKTTT